MTYRVIQGNNIEVLKTFPDNSVDSVVTDPPYGIDFLGKDWDSDTGSIETYIECLRVLKPGGYLLAFSASRTYHHLAMTVERAGFEIRDQIMWIYSQGFVKGNNLKPAHEPIVMARKPSKKQQLLNIDDCRIPIVGKDTRNGGSNGWNRIEFGEREPNKSDGTMYTPNELGRYPSNVIGEITDYQKYYYCPKANTKERSVGNNTHPTVKPVELMKYLIKLVTPKNGTVLDPYNGSGSTGVACVELGYSYIGIELDQKYVDITNKRLEQTNGLFVIEE